MARYSDPMIIGTHIYLKVVAAPGDPLSFGRGKYKTSVWSVRTQEDHVPIGRIQWHGAWRCYAFFPAADSLFEPTCLHEIAVACQMATYIQRTTGKKPQ